MKVPEAVLERFNAILTDAECMWSADHPDAPQKALEAALEQLRKELEGEEIRRLAGRSGIAAALSSVLGEPSPERKV